MAATAKPRFGDLVENGWASEENPTRRGFFVREIRNGARRTWEITDGKGKFWRCPLDSDHKLTWAPAASPPLEGAGRGEDGSSRSQPVSALLGADCPCYRCTLERCMASPEPSECGVDMRMARMFLCPACGNKRCPMAADHLHQCGGSNEPGQRGSLYELTPEPSSPVASDQAQFEAWIADRYVEKSDVDRETATEFAAAFFERTAGGAMLTFGNDEYSWTMSDAKDVADEDMSCWESE